MKEVTDPQVLNLIRQQFPAIALFLDTQVPCVLYRAWETDKENWYQIEMSISYQIPIKGFIDTQRGLVYLDAVSIMTIVQNRIDTALHAYNSGHDPRYRGM